MFGLKKTVPVSSIISEPHLNHFVVFKEDEAVGVPLKDVEFDEGALVTFRSVGVDGDRTDRRSWRLIGRSDIFSLVGTFSSEDELNVSLRHFGLSELQLMKELE